MHMNGMIPYGDGAGPRMKPMVQMEPWVYQRLKQAEGMRVVVDTVRGSVTGVLVDVKPDHIAVQDAPGQSVFFVRLSQIVWVMPDLD